jgi:2-polyprenyl-3-methyl-5-hydroxy-6-metoxy-1,4-benzoquinol methylase
MILPKTKLVKRIDYITSLCKDKSILHVGCADSPNTIWKFETDCLLHKHLMKVSKELFGIDIDKKGVEDLKKLGIKNVYQGNVEELKNINYDKKFSIVVAGEIIEHLINPGLFLNSIKRFLKKEGSLIITTQNAFSIKRALRLLWRNEVTSTAHTFYFSYLTLKKLLEKCGYAIGEIRMFNASEGDLYVKQRLISKIVNKLLDSFSIFNYWADGLIVQAKIKY